MLRWEGLVAIVLIAASMSCSGEKDAVIPSGSGGAGVGGSGGVVSVGGSADGGGGAPAGGSGSGTGAACADGSAFPGAVAPEQPIRVHFELLYDPSTDDPLNIPSWFEFTDDCGMGAVGPEDIPGFAPWGECVAQYYVDSWNAAFSELLGSEAPLFVFDSFVASPDAALARGLGLSELPSAVEPLIQPGFVNAFLVMDIEGDAGGVARLSQSYPTEYTGVAAIAEATQPWQVLVHEIGHAIGFPHVGGATTSGLARYECCGGFEVETLPGSCSANLMCERAGATFDTCDHGEFLKRIAACWISGQGGPTCGDHTCSFASGDEPPIAYCDPSADGLTCTCTENQTTFAAVDCNDAVVRFLDICDPPNQVCELFESSACPEGEGCYPVLGEEPQCLPLGTLPVGADCPVPSICVEGSICLATVSLEQGVCGLVCDPSDTAPESVKCPTDCTTLSLWSDTLAVCATGP